MTVKELIKLLQKQNQDALVYFRNNRMMHSINIVEKNQWTNDIIELTNDECKPRKR